MHTNLYITATETRSGKSAIVLSMMHVFTRTARSIAFFRPIINEPVWDDKDHDISLMLQHFNLNIPYKDTFAYTLDEARHLINSGQRNLVMENILQKFRTLTEEYDMVVCEGTDFLGKDAAFELELNAEIAANLGCGVLVITNGSDKSADDIHDSTQVIIDQLQGSGLDILAMIINRATLSESEKDDLRAHLVFKATSEKPLLYFIPDEPSLGQPTMGDVCKWLDAEIIYGANRLDSLVSNYLIAAMQVHNFLDYVAEGSLVITPGDRTDIVLASMASRMSAAYPDISGVLLTGGIPLPAKVRQLLEGWTGVPVPILLTKHHTYKTVDALSHLYGRIEPTDARKISTALGLFERHVNGKEIANRISTAKPTRVTPMMFEFDLIERAKSCRMRIVLAEGEEERILRATDILLRREVAEIIILGNADVIGRRISELGLEMSNVRIIQPELSPLFEAYANTYFELRKAKGITLEQARDRMMDPTYFATMMVKKNDADGMVSGAINTTAHTIRPAFEFIKTKPGISIVSSVFLMCLKDSVLVFGDCAVNPNPTASQLAEIAIASADTARVFGIEPRVAMLSYSTGTSGKGADVDVVVEAVKVAKEKAPHLLLEGPIQYDAAIDPSVARTKLPNSQIAGRATVFIFPDLNTGNNTYKAVQRAADAIAIGPVLQGLNKPVNDLSRGCTVADIVNTVAITAVQAAAEKQASS
ncbi:MAG: phosphate acetyltransferase [Desulfovibrionaceae bacterium]